MCKMRGLACMPRARTPNTCDPRDQERRVGAPLLAGGSGNDGRVLAEGGMSPWMHAEIAESAPGSVFTNSAPLGGKSYVQANAPLSYLNDCPACPRGARALGPARRGLPLACAWVPGISPGLRSLQTDKALPTGRLPAHLSTSWEVQVNGGICRLAAGTNSQRMFAH